MKKLSTDVSYAVSLNQLSSPSTSISGTLTIFRTAPYLNAPCIDSLSSASYHKCGTTLYNSVWEMRAHSQYFPCKPHTIPKKATMPILLLRNLDARQGSRSSQTVVKSMAMMVHAKLFDNPSTVLYGKWRGILIQKSVHLVTSLFTQAGKKLNVGAYERELGRFCLFVCPSNTEGTANVACLQPCAVRYAPTFTSGSWTMPLYPQKL